MQATSPVYRQAADLGWLTTTSLVLIVVFAAIVLAAIAYGVRLAVQRKHARRIEEERVEAEAPATPDPAPLAPPAARTAPEPEAPRAEPVPSRSDATHARDDAPAMLEPTRIPVAPAPPPLDIGPVAGTPAADPFPEAPDLTDQPVAAAAPLDASPAVEAESAPAPPAGPAPGERPITTLKGLGPKVAARLGELGIATVGDLAALDPAQAEALDARLGPFTGRMARDRWLEQARLLAAGDDKTFEAQFGKLS